MSFTYHLGTSHVDIHTSPEPWALGPRHCRDGLVSARAIGIRAATNALSVDLGTETPSSDGDKPRPDGRLQGLAISHKLSRLMMHDLECNREGEPVE